MRLSPGGAGHPGSRKAVRVAEGAAKPQPILPSERNLPHSLRPLRRASLVRPRHRLNTRLRLKRELDLYLGETPLQSARRRLREAEERAEKQRRSVEQLSRAGRRSALAAELLAELERVVRNQQDEVRTLERDREGR